MKISFKEKCKHKIEEKLFYPAEAERAEERIKKGWKQKKCPVCNLWIWEKHYYKRRQDEHRKKV